MTSNPTDPAIKNTRRVDLEDPDEVRAWCAHFALSEANLRTAVVAVGPMSAAIHTYINSRGRRERARGRQTGELGPPFVRHVATACHARPSIGGVAADLADPLTLSVRDGIYEVTLTIGGVATRGFATVRDGVIQGFDTLQGVGGTIAIDEEPFLPS